jgi:hypothetical protein
MSWFFAVVGPAAQGLDRQRLAVVTEKPHSELAVAPFISLPVDGVKRCMSGVTANRGFVWLASV